jgi:hypothetical protein
MLHHTGRLFQEYNVDDYTQIEQNRLRWNRMNQDTLRVDLYKDLANVVADGVNLSDVDQRTVLPSSFIGGPRAMRANYHDAMAIIRSRGRPDYFIIMTCNIKWKEITEALESNQIV